MSLKTISSRITSPGIFGFWLRHKFNLSLIIVLVVVLGLATFLITKVLNRPASALPIQEVDLPFNPNGPYAILEPRRDGNAIILNIKRVNGYEKISYELAYSSVTNDTGESIDRGVTGNLAMGSDPKDRKSEYSQEILFGTCSKGDTFSTLHCVFDKGVENGTLTLRIFQTPKSGDKFQTVYKMVTTWHLQKPDVALGTITSADGHLTFKTSALRVDLTNVGFTLVNELTGAPKLPEGKVFVGKVYAFNIPVAKTFPKGTVSLELADKPTTDTKLARYDFAKDSWEIVDSKVNGSFLTADVVTNGIFAAVASSQ